MSSSIPASLEHRRELAERISVTLENPHHLNLFNQPVGPSLPDWVPVQRPKVNQLTGQYVNIVELDVDKHLDQLWSVFGNVDDSYWTYLFCGPFANKEEFKIALEEQVASPHYYMTICENETNKPIGYINLMNINVQNGSIEIGSVCFGPQLQKNRKGTEVIWLLLQYCFETLGYRRVEWKCDANNIPSRRAALRFGFVFEGMFRKHFVYRGRARDTTWFSITDDEFTHVVKPSMLDYLSPENFTLDAVQIKSLPECRKFYRAKFDEGWVALKDSA